MSVAKNMKAKILELDQLPSQLIEYGSIAITRDFSPQQVVKMAVEKGAHHIVQKACRSFEQELLVSENMMFRPQEFLKDPVSMILEHKQVHNFRVDCAAQEHKKEPLEKLEGFIRGLAGSKGIITEVVASTEEIFTNASKNSGVFYKHLSSIGGIRGTAPVARQGSMSVVAGATDDTLVVGVIDSFGLLDAHALLAKVLSCYENGVAQSINMGTGGAGIGTFLVFSFAMNMYIAVEKNNRTAVFCSYPLGMRTRDFEILPKNLHLISI